MIEKKDKSAYQAMLKATSVLASAKFFTIGTSIIRTKILAIILGPTGLGIVNVILSSLDLGRVFSTFGLDSATARRVASAAANNEQHEVLKVYYVAVRTALYLGVIAAVIFACLSPVLASHLFGETGEAWWFIVAALGLIGTPLLTVELAFLQGLQQSKSLALCQVLASVIGSIMTIVLVLLYKIDGAVIALVSMVLSSVYVHHKFVKKHLPKNILLKKDNFFKDSSKLLRMGSAYALNGIWITVAGYLNIIFLTNYYGPSAAAHQIGLNGAAMMISSVYINIIISAMGAEFYPRLVAVSNDRKRLGELINQQTRLSISLGVPGGAVLFLLAPLLLGLLYSPEFTEASNLMRWAVFGMIIRFMTCPIGLAVYATCRPRTIAANELLTGIGTIMISYTMIRIFGLEGVGIGLMLANFLYLVAVASFMATRSIRWPKSTIQLVSLVLIFFTCMLFGHKYLSGLHFYTLFVTSVLLLSLYLLNDMKKEMNISWTTIQNKIYKFFTRN